MGLFSMAKGKAVCVENIYIPENNPPGYRECDCCSKCINFTENFEYEAFTTPICMKYRIEVDRHCICKEYKFNDRKKTRG